jgi:integrase
LCNGFLRASIFASTVRVQRGLLPASDRKYGALTSDRIDHDKIFLYTAKTGVAVMAILPPSVVAALVSTPMVTNKNYFWSGNGKRETAVCDYQEKLKNAFASAGIIKGLSNAVSHRLRDTFAISLLLHGVPIERVAVLLGNSVRICERHYSPWVRSRQEQLESDMRNAWANDSTLTQNGGTNPVQVEKGMVN